MTVQAADPSGTWTWTSPGRDGQTRTTTLKIKAEGEKLTGTVSGRQGSEDIKISDGKIAGDEISFTVVREFNGNTMTQKFTGKVAGDKITGKIVGKNRDGEERTRDWEAKKGEAK